MPCLSDERERAARNGAEGVGHTLLGGMPLNEE
ncbi:hypothetical protein PTHTG4_29040 [Parageobacillus thermoglucosidasius]|nr:hypothetical protein PTHTG4_29040 [Parageobacillus thermoglucosidasius]